MESWRKMWRDGFAPQLSADQLAALRDALASDDVRLIQAGTSSPPPMTIFQDLPCESACALGLCGVSSHGGFGVATVGEVEEFFARACFEADRLVNEPAACRYFLNWFDDSPRDRMRSELLTEVERALELATDGKAVA